MKRKVRKSKKKEAGLGGNEWSAPQRNVRTEKTFIFYENCLVRLTTTNDEFVQLQDPKKKDTTSEEEKSAWPTSNHDVNKCWIASSFGSTVVFVVDIETEAVRARMCGLSTHYSSSWSLFRISICFTIFEYFCGLKLNFTGAASASTQDFGSSITAGLVSRAEKLFFFSFPGFGAEWAINFGFINRVEFISAQNSFSFSFFFVTGRGADNRRHEEEANPHRLCCPFIDLFGAFQSPREREMSFFSIHSAEAVESEKHVLRRKRWRWAST